MSMAQPRGDSFTRAPGFMSGPQMRPGMSRVSRLSASPCTKQPLHVTTVTGGYQGLHIGYHYQCWCLLRVMHYMLLLWLLLYTKGHPLGVVIVASGSEGYAQSDRYTHFRAPAYRYRYSLLFLLGSLILMSDCQVVQRKHAKLNTVHSGSVR